jgi:hypothetical protein
MNMLKLQRNMEFDLKYENNIPNSISNNNSNNILKFNIESELYLVVVICMLCNSLHCIIYFVISLIQLQQTVILLPPQLRRRRKTEAMI